MLSMAGSPHSSEHRSYSRAGIRPGRVTSPFTAGGTALTQISGSPAFRVLIVSLVVSGVRLARNSFHTGRILASTFKISDARSTMPVIPYIADTSSWVSCASFTGSWLLT